MFLQLQLRARYWPMCYKARFLIWGVFQDRLDQITFLNTHLYKKFVSSGDRHVICGADSEPPHCRIDALRCVSFHILIPRLEMTVSFLKMTIPRTEIITVSVKI